MFEREGKKPPQQFLDLLEDARNFWQQEYNKLWKSALKHPNYAIIVNRLDMISVLRKI